jgi:hypothetical protein
MTNLPRDPKPWLSTVTDPDLAGRRGWTDTHGETPSRRQPCSHGAPDRTLARNCAGQDARSAFLSFSSLAVENVGQGEEPGL